MCVKLCIHFFSFSSCQSEIVPVQQACWKYKYNNLFRCITKLREVDTVAFGARSRRLQLNAHIIWNTVDSVAEVICILTLKHIYNPNGCHLKKTSNYSSGDMYYHHINVCTYEQQLVKNGWSIFFYFFFYQGSQLGWISLVIQIKNKHVSQPDISSPQRNHILLNQTLLPFIGNTINSRALFEWSNLASSSHGV